MWGPFGGCEGEGECYPGDAKSKECGNCGEQSKTCDEFCEWSLFGSCSGEGICGEGDVDSQPCGETSIGSCKLGQQSRQCNAAVCEYGDWGSCSGEVGPTQEICGNNQDEDCNGNVLLQPDEWESNNTCQECYDLGEDPDVTLYPTTSQQGDDDFFCFTGKDSPANPSEGIIVELSDMPPGVDLDIHLFKEQQGCASNEPLASSVNAGSQDESLVWADPYLSDDTGLYIIQVKHSSSTWSCDEPYTLHIKGLQ